MSKALLKHLFSYLRELLECAKAEYERRHGDGKWSGPKPAQISMHRLANATLLTDSCNRARVARRSVADKVAMAVELHMGEKWATLTQEEQDLAVHVRSLDCFQHLRNIFLNEGAVASSKHLQVHPTASRLPPLHCAHLSALIHANAHVSADAQADPQCDHT